MLLITGQVDRIQEREAGNAPNTWTERTIVVRDWGQTFYVTAARDFTDLPAAGEMVALDAGVRAYVNKAGRAGYGYTAFRRNTETESNLFGSSKLRAAQ